MKKIILPLLVFVCILINAKGQTLFGNEWIFDYSKTYYKIKVTQNGLIRIPYSTLQAAGLGNAQGRDFVLFGRGQEIPIFVTTANAMNPTDFIEFYGEKNDGWLDAWLYRNPQNEQFNPYYSMFNDTAVYFLAVQNVVSHKRVIASPNNTTSQSAEPYYLSTALYESHSSYAGGVNFPLGSGHIAVPSSFDAGEGWFGLFFNSTTSQTVATPTPYYGFSTGFSVDIITSGVYSGNNNISASINGQYSFSNPTFFDVAINRFTAANLSNTILVNGYTPVSFSTTGSYEGVSAIKIVYPRVFDFNNETQEYFQLNNSATTNSNKYLYVRNFNALGTDAILYDFDLNQRLIDVNNTGAKTAFSFLLGPSTSSNRNIFLSSDNNTTVVTQLTPQKFVDFSQVINQGNYVIITHKDYRNDGTGHDYVKDYASYRKSIVGGTYDTAIVDIDMLYDEFAYGIVRHSIAIRNFAHYMDFYFSKPKPFQIFLIGKGQVYSDFRTDPTRITLCKVPTFGNPGSDNLLTAYNNDWYPHIAIGRLSCFNGNEVKTYLDKMKEYEAAQQENCATGTQTLANKDWMKQLVHLTGGSTLYEQSKFDCFLNTGACADEAPLIPMKKIVEDSLFGGNVTIFKKTSAAPVQLSSSYKLDSLINSGVSMINFFGHSAFSTLEFAVDNPSSYQNFGKYPVFISNGCFSGNLFEDPALQTNNARGLSERFVVPDAGDPQNIGAIAYISTSDLGISSGLNDFTNHVYQNFARDHYGNTLGECIRIAVDSIMNGATLSVFDVVVSGEQMLLNGDPALRINPASKPDLVIEPSLVALNPSTITLEQGNTFQVNFTIENIGQFKNDSVNIFVFRYFPKADLTLSSTSTFVTTQRIKIPAYRSSFSIPVKLEAEKSLGANRIQIVVDASNELTEVCENNNTANIDFNISSLDVLPVYPSQFSILSATDTIAFSLKSSTIDALAPARNYFIQFDTTEKFNSSLLQTKKINQTGGVVNWKPHTNWIDNRVYYWRIAVDTIYGNHNITWHNSSFTYISGSSAGWDQSHYFEFKKDDFLSMYIDSATRKFKFANNIRAVKVKDFGSGLDADVAPYLDYQKLNSGGSCLPYASYGFSNQVAGGFNIVLFDSVFGQAVPNGYGSNPQTGDYTCGGRQIPIFQYLTKFHLTSSTWPYNIPSNSQAPNDSVQRTYLDNFLNNYVKNGTYVLLYSINDFSPQTFGTALHNTLHNIFKTKVIDTMTSSRTYVLFGKKGANGYTTHEVQASTIGGMIDTSFYFSGNWYEGSITSVPIGPVASWTSMHWSYNPQETNSADSTSIQLIGIDANGNETVVYENHTNQQFDFPINFVSATQYPFLKMRMTTKDTLHRTPAQLNYWRINYQPIPELALDANTAFNFHADTIVGGEKVTLKMALRNVSNVKMDTTYLKYSVVKSNNLKDSFYLKIRPINANDTAMINLSLTSALYNGNNFLFIDANAYDAIPPAHNKHKNELYHFNNSAKFKFYVNIDKTNPLLDVTFDGQHIMSGDLVSAKPHVIIKLKDENKNLPLDTLSLFTISMKKPGSNNFYTITPYNTNLKFTPATNARTNNSATIELDPILSGDGTYTLRVQGHDRSSNTSGQLDYLVDFSVINKPMISNVLNYPNPFTTQTHFVFTLTGSELPTYFKIQIFTITGKVVREINLTELGEGLHIGKNITQYAWDGKDEYGGNLANGLYLYRVVTNLKGNGIEHYNTSADKYFTSGFGKMYFMR